MKTKVNKPKDATFSACAVESQPSRFTSLLGGSSCVLLALLVAFFCYFHWGSFFAPFERDEGEYAYSAWLLRNGHVPYRESFLQKPPLIIYTYALAQLIDGTALWAPRLLAAVSTFSSVILTALIAAYLYGRQAFWVAAFFAVPLLSLPHIAALAANTEKFMMTPLLGLFFWHVVRWDKALRSGEWLGWGALFALSFFYKPLGVIVMTGLVCYRLYHEFWGQKLKAFTWRSSIGSLLLLGTGFFIVTVIVFYYFFCTASLAYLWESAFAYNRLYAKNFFAGASWSRFSYYIEHIFLASWPIMICFVASYLLRVRAVLFWTLFIGLGIASVYSTVINHYYLLPMPFIVILAAGALVKISKRLAANDWGQILFLVLYLAVAVFSIAGGARRVMGLGQAGMKLGSADWFYSYYLALQSGENVVVLGATTILTIVLIKVAALSFGNVLWRQAVIAALYVVGSLFQIVQPYYREFIADQQAHTIWIYDWFNPFYESLLIGKYVQDTTKPEDKIFVAGSEAQIYFYAQRRGVSRFNITFPLDIDTEKKFHYQEELLTSLSQDLPEIIVYSRQESSAMPNDNSSTEFLQKFYALLNKNYSLEAGYVMSPDNRRAGQLKKIVSAEEFHNSTMVIYRRR